MQRARCLNIRIKVVCFCQIVATIIGCQKILAFELEASANFVELKILVGEAYWSADPIQAASSHEFKIRWRGSIA